MPVIFHKAFGVWSVLPISVPLGTLSLAPVAYEPDPAACPAPPDSLALMLIDPEREWAALIPEGVRVFHNGQPVTAGLRILAHRDSLAMPGASLVFFSTEETARIEPFAGPDRVPCPRCKLEIEPGTPAVKCPGCGVLHHEVEGRPCWIYAQACAVCPHPTLLGTGLQWTPDAL